MQCVTNKIPELELFLTEYPTDICCLTEHWLHPDQISAVKIDGYKLGSVYTRETYIHGGVMILIQENIKCEEISEIKNFAVEKICECCAINCEINKVKFAVLAVYRSPNTDINLFFDVLCNCLSYLQKPGKNQNIILCGDFNINILLDSSETIDFINHLNSYNVKLTINEPTRVSRTSKSCIDNIGLSVDDNLQYESNVIFSGLSDHTAQIINIFTDKTHESSQITTYHRVINKQNQQIFEERLSNESWEEVFHEIDPDVQYEVFINIIRYHYEICFPLKKKNKKCETKKCWVTRGISISSNKLKDLYFTSISGTEYDKNYYKKYKAIYKKVLQDAKKKYNDEMLIKSKNKTRTAWNIIKRCTNSKNNNNNIEELEVDKTIINNPHQISNEFNKYFNEAPTKISNELLNTDMPKLNSVNNNTFYMAPTCTIEIIDIIKSLKPSNSAGMDEISTNLLKHIAHQISRPLTHIINTSIEKGIFPTKMKTGKIIPIYKKGNKLQMENYRPISLLSFSKILEKIVAKRLTSFLIKSNILSPNQFGFRQGLSTSDAIITYLDELFEGLNSGNNALGIFLDLSKAFDLVNHDILVSKLECYGVRGRPLSWFRSYLENRHHLVDIKGHQSQTLKLSMGVPQGSVLGPLLFIVYINDLDEFLNFGKIVMFADDTSILGLAPDIKTLQNATTQTNLCLSKWFNGNKLKVNWDKTVFIKFTPTCHTCNESLLIRYDNKSIQQKSSHRFLGLEIDSSLKWNNHISNVCTKISSLCYVLRHLKKFVNDFVLKSFYFAQIQSVLAYGLICWGTQTQISKVFVMQKRAIRIMFELGPRVSCKPIFKREKILPLPCLYIYQVLIYTHKNINKFTTLGDTHEYKTRNMQKLKIPNHRTTLYEKGPKYNSIKIYNQLPNKYKTMSLYNFKINVKKFLLEHSFYSTEEFLNTSFNSS